MDLRGIVGRRRPRRRSRCPFTWEFGRSGACASARLPLRWAAWRPLSRSAMVSAVFRPNGRAWAIMGACAFGGHRPRGRRHSSANGADGSRCWCGWWLRGLSPCRRG